MKKKLSIVISAVVLAKNEAVRIRECLDSLAWADEIIVVDNNSEDNTVEIAQKTGATVVTSNATNFSILRTIGMDAAKGEWVLYVDADEIVSTPLELEICRLLRGFSRAVDPVCYFISRKNYYLGVLWPVGDRMQRLIYKSSFVRWVGSLHETAIVRGSTGILKHELIHHTHRNLEEMKRQIHGQMKKHVSDCLSKHKNVDMEIFFVFIKGLSGLFSRTDGELSEVDREFRD